MHKFKFRGRPCGDFREVDVLEHADGLLILVTKNIMSVISNCIVRGI